MIKTNLKITNFEATPDVREYLDKKLAKIVDIAKQHQEEVILRVEIGKNTEHHQQGEVFRAEIQTHVNGKDHRAVSEREDIFSAIDDAQEMLLQELLQNKKKNETLMKKGGRKLKEAIRKFYN